MPIVTAGLTSHWDFKDGTGTTISDVVGSNGGTLNGTTTNFWNRVDRHGDPVGNANGTDNWVNVPGVSTFPTGDFSFSVLFWPNRNTYTATGVFFHFSSPSNGINARLASNGISATFQGATQKAETFPLTELWQMWLVLQVAYDSATGNYRIRLGKKEITGTHTIGTTVTNNLRLLGPGSTLFAGRMGDVLWYNSKELTGAEMDQNLDALLERARGSITVATPDTTHSKTVITLPHDGSKVAAASPNQEGVLSTTNKIYVADFIVDGTNGKATFYRYDKTWNLEETVQPFGPQSQDETHRTPAIGVDVNGKPLLHNGPHGGSWVMRRADSADDLDPSTAVADPLTGESLTYLHFYRSPATGTAYFGLQDANKYRWLIDDGSAFSTLGGIHYDRSLQNTYWGHLVEGSDGKLYSTTSWHDGAAGGPYHHVNVMYSANSGTTWKRLTDDGTITLPATHETADAAISRTLQPTGAGTITDSDFGGVTPRPVATSNGALHWVVGWSNQVEGDHATLRSSWYVRWNPTAKHFEHYRVLADDGINSAGPSQIVQNPSDDSLHFVLTSKNTSAYNVYLYSSFDQGDTWERRILNDQSVVEVLQLGVPDAEGARLDGVWRSTLQYTATPADAEVWEFALPSASAGVTVQASPASLTLTAQPSSPILAVLAVQAEPAGLNLAASQVTPTLAPLAVSAAPAGLSVEAQAVSPVIVGGPVAIHVTPALLNLTASVVSPQGGTPTFGPEWPLASTDPSEWVLS